MDTELMKDAKQQFIQRLVITICIVAILLGIGLFWGDKNDAQKAAAQRNSSSKNIIATPVTAKSISYGKDLSGKYESRLAHVMAHTKPDASKPIHSVFRVKSEADVKQLLDEAWKKRGPPIAQGGKFGRDVYDVDMGRVVGTRGETNIRLVMERGSADIVTAYPFIK